MTIYACVNTEMAKMFEGTLCGLFWIILSGHLGIPLDLVFITRISFLIKRGIPSSRLNGWGNFFSTTIREVLEAAAFRLRCLFANQSAHFPATLPKILQANMLCLDLSTVTHITKKSSIYSKMQKTPFRCSRELQSKNIEKKQKSCTICDMCLSKSLYYPISF